MARAVSSTVPSTTCAPRGRPLPGPPTPPPPPAPVPTRPTTTPSACASRCGPAWRPVAARSRRAPAPPPWGASTWPSTAAGRERFLRVLATDFVVDHDAVAGAAEALRRTAGSAARRQAEQSLRAALDPPRVRLLTQFNELPEGVKFLVDMRAELLPPARHDAKLKALDDDLRSLLATWFDVGFLELRRITWDSGSAALLEKLMAYEAVPRHRKLGRPQEPARFGTAAVSLISIRACRTSP